MDTNSFKKCLTVIVLCLVARFAGAQSEPAKETAIRQMRQIAEAIKKCPEEIKSRLESAVVYYGPPSNVEWDVLPSKSVRSPFQGWVEFTLPLRWEETEKAKRSEKLHERYLLLKLTDYRRTGHFRYEFDLGSDPPELVKMLWFDDKTKGFEAAAIQKTCWQNAVRSGNVTGVEKTPVSSKP